MVADKPTEVSQHIRKKTRTHTNNASKSFVAAYRREKPSFSAFMFREIICLLGVCVYAQTHGKLVVCRRTLRLGVVDGGRNICCIMLHWLRVDTTHGRCKLGV